MTEELEQAGRDMSTAKKIAALPVGGSYSISHRLAATEAPKLHDTITQLRNNLAPPVSRAAKKTGIVFSTETGTIITRSGDLIAVAVVTRMS